MATPFERAADLGFEISQDGDQPGRYYWRNHDTLECSDISFDTPQEALHSIIALSQRNRVGDAADRSAPDDDGAASDVARIDLTLSLEYRLNGADPGELRDLLREAVEHMMGNGMITGATPAEIERSEVHLDVLNEAAMNMSHEDIADFYADRLENASLNLEEIPSVIASLALARPAEVMADIHERMDELGYFDDEAEEATESPR